MKRLIVILSALLFATAAWAICPPVLQIVGGENAGAPGTCSGTYGTTTYTAGIAAVGASYRCYINKVTIDCSETSGQICAGIDDVNTSTAQATLVLYDDDGGSGEPSTLIDSYEIDDIVSDPTNHCEAFSGSVSAGDYWVGICFENSSSDYRHEATTGGTGRYYTPGSYTVPSPWPHATDSTSAYDRTFYLNFP
jgi:hypothetical protein